MSCPDERFIIQLAEGALQGEQREAISDHLDVCPACQAAVAELARDVEDGPNDELSTVANDVARRPLGWLSASQLTAIVESGGRYEILERIGVGGMGIVYEARDRVLERRVALKLLRPDVADADGQEVASARLLREAQAVAQLNHPNVVTVHDAGLLPSGTVFIAMERVDGVTLRQWLETTRDWRAITKVFLAAGRGLAAAHAKGIVHRDFKPENVLVDARGRVLVTDFGLARGFDGGGASLAQTVSNPLRHTNGLELTITRTGLATGTPAYMAPEQHRGNTVDPRADQFSFCVAFYEALDGDRPFEGSTLTELAENVCRGRVRPLQARSGATSRVFEVLHRGLLPNPADRWTSMEELLARLGRCIRPRRWPRWIAASLTLATVTGLWLTRREQTCRDLDVPLARVWNADTARRLGSAHAEFGRAGEEAWTRIEPELESWARAWREARQDACELHANGEQSDRVLDLRMRCLDEKLHELAALLDIMADPDEVVVSHGVEAAKTIAALTTCSDPALLERAVPDPPEALAPDVDRLRSELTKIRAATAAGRYEEALAHAREIAEQADALGFEPLIAESTLELGGLYGAHEMHQLAELAADAAMARAIATGQVEILARGALNLFEAVAARPERHEEAARHALRADAALRRAGDPAHLRARWLMTQTRCAAEAARWDEAQAHAHTLSQLIESASLSGNTLAIALNTQGDLRRRRGAHAEAIALFERALTARREALGRHHPEVARDLNNLALSLDSIGQPQQALERYEEALDALRSGFSDDHPDVARVLNNVGMTLTQMRRFDEAVDRLTEALRIKERWAGADSPELGTTLANLAIAERARGNLDRAARRLERARDVLVRRFGDDHPLIVRVQRHAAEVAIAHGELTAAEVEIGAALQTRAGHDWRDADARGLALVRAEVMLLGDRPEEALLLVRAIRTAQDEAEDVIETERLVTDALVGRALAATGDVELARPTLEVAVRSLSELATWDTSALVRARWAWASVQEHPCEAAPELHEQLPHAVLLAPHERTRIVAFTTECNHHRLDR